MTPGRLRLLLGIGAAAGLAAALSGVFSMSVQPGEDYIAIVDGEGLRRADYDRAMEALAQDKQSPIEHADRAHVLRRLLDEYLLIRRGAELGYAHSEPSVRQAVVNAVIQTALEQGAAAEVEEDDLAEFYRGNTGYFAPPPQVRVRAAWIKAAGDDDDDPGRLERARKILAEGGDLGELEYPAPLSVPGGWIPLSRLQNYLGGSVVQRLGQMRAGEVSEPFPSGANHLIVQLAAVREVETPPFEAVREQVLHEFTRRRNEATLGEYLDWLHERANIRYADDAPLE